MKKQKKRGFTLIELLVAILIIGILAAVALPQYQRAVEKAHGVEAQTMVKNLYYAAEKYYLENGSWPPSFDQLDISIGSHNTDWAYSVNSGDSELERVYAVRRTGPYAGGGFRIIHKYGSMQRVPLRSLVCTESITKIQTPGDYCTKLFRSKLVHMGGSVRYYTLS